MMRKFFAVTTSVLMLLLAFIGVMGMLGYRLIEGVVTYILFGALIMLVLVGLAMWITGKIQRRGLRALVGTVLTLIVAAAFLLVFTFFVFLCDFYVERHYTTLTSPGGRKLAVMYSYSQERAAERIEARGGDGITDKDLGRVYQIYPVFSKFFYNSNLPAEGEIEIGCGSAAVLMHRWEGERLHMYIDQPEEFDSGELIFH